MTTVLITGASGLLGSTLVPLLRLGDYEVKTLSRKGIVDFRADLTDPCDTTNALNRVMPDVIVNLAALTDVELCESNPDQAYFANVKAVKNITNWMSEFNKCCHLVQVSTDHVYDGKGPQTEEQISLKNYYAFSKYAGELMAGYVQSTILRANFFGPSQCEHKHSLTDWILHSLAQKNAIQVFDDIFFSPLSMTTFASMVEKVIQKKPVGTYNLGSRNGMSKADFAFSFAKAMNLPTKRLERVVVEHSHFLKTYRPKDMRMDCTKFENSFNLVLPSLAEEIDVAAKEYHERA